MMFAFERPSIRLYSYYFLGISKPIVIQAYNKIEARNRIESNWKRLGKEYQNSRIIGETVSVATFGVSTREDGGKTLVWVGKENSPSGWMEMGEFQSKFEK